MEITSITNHRIRNSKAASLGACIVFLIGTVFMAIYKPTLLIEAVEKGIGHGCLFLLVFLAGWLYWAFVGHPRWEGWTIQVESLDETKYVIEVSHETAKAWVTSNISPVGVGNWIHFCQLLDQADNACPPIWRTREETEKDEALVIDRENKAFRFFYRKLAAARVRKANLPVPQLVD